MTAEIDDLIDDLGNADPDLRSAARQHLLAHGSQVVELLSAVVRTQAGIQSVEAARVLSQLDDPRIVETMREFLSSSNPFIGQIALETLEYLQMEDLVPVLTNALPHSKPIVQLTMVDLLERLGDKRAVSPLMDLLRQASSPSLRYTIIQALGVLGDPQAISLIWLFRGDEDHHVRKRVQIALERLTGSKAGNTRESL